MTKVQNFSENLERNLSRLGEKVGEHLENPEVKNLPEREIVKHSIRALADEVLAGDDKNTPTEVVNMSDGSSVLPSYLNNVSAPQDAKTVVEELVNATFSGGLESAIRLSRKQSPFIEDAFHDALADKLLPELKKRGILK